ncbi:MAG TPA: DUF2764 family protein [Candidatus Sumerlaeota bacterium]|nr:DUF2764 family protein [Candidatus Sumerlaeota bacterium]
MAGNYYLLTSLPTLDALGAEPPMSAAEFAERVADADGPAEIVRAILLGDDLLQRDAFLAGELDQPSPAVLTPAQARNEQPLPEFLAASGAPEDSHTQRSTTDRLWASYFRHAAGLAATRRNAFLSEWVRHEVGLRNALATARAKALDLNATDYLAAPELGLDAAGFEETVGEWAGATDLVAAQRVLDAARWQWITSHDAWFGFGDDELAAYAAKLSLMERWRRLAEAQREQPDDTDRFATQADQ